MDGRTSADGMNEVGINITRALSSRGAPPDVRGRLAATAWLLDHAAEAYPIVLGMAMAPDADAAVIELLGRFRRPESTDLLVAALDASAAVTRAAAAALGTSPDPDAAAALVAAVRGGSRQQRVAALDGLGASGQEVHCDLVRACLSDDDTEIRWMATHAAARLRCVSMAELRAIAADDVDHDVRALAAELSDP
jgi:hypothetical protein